VNAGDEVEPAGQQLQADQPGDLGDLLVTVAVRAQALDVRVADLGRRGEDLLGERDDRGDRRIA
jgi:hypothetical protein